MNPKRVSAPARGVGHEPAPSHQASGCGPASSTYPVSHGTLAGEPSQVSGLAGTFLPPAVERSSFALSDQSAATRQFVDR
jgi:hypothetical protein